MVRQDRMYILCPNNGVPPKSVFAAGAFVMLILAFCSKLKNWFRTYIYQHGENKHVDNMTQLKRWERDFQLERLSRLHLFDEYIEMSK